MTKLSNFYRTGREVAYGDVYDNPTDDEIADWARRVLDGDSQASVAEAAAAKYFDEPAYREKTWTRDNRADIKEAGAEAAAAFAEFKRGYLDEATLLVLEEIAEHLNEENDEDDEDDDGDEDGDDEEDED